MKQRILSRWTLTRVLYLLLGVLVIIQAVLIQQWIGILIGGYFSAMGLFAFGCAGGNCFGANCSVPSKKINAPEEIEFEEIKTK